LRIYPTPQVPAGLAPHDMRRAQFAANSRNCVISFMFRQRIGFIEPLPEYADRLDRLQRGQAPRLITALMVCDAGTDDVDPANVATWFPIDLLNLLSLATGVRVGAPWIEFRDEHAKLSRRIHVCFGSPTYRLGHPAVMEQLAPNTGYLLTKC